VISPSFARPPAVGAVRGANLSPHSLLIVQQSVELRSPVFRSLPRHVERPAVKVASLRVFHTPAAHQGLFGDQVQVYHLLRFVPHRRFSFRYLIHPCTSILVRIFTLSIRHPRFF